MTARVLSARNVIKVLGGLVTIAAVALVVDKIRANWSVLVNWHAPFPVEWIILIGALVYAASSHLLSKAWVRLLAYLGQTGINKSECSSIYARTQLAKYLPGNVFHLASRHVLTNQAGTRHGATAGAAVFEVIGLIGSACAVSLLGFVFKASLSGGVSVILYLGVLCGAISFPLLVNWALGKVRSLKKLDIPAKRPKESLRSLLPVYSLYGSFFIVSGGILLWLVYLISGAARLQTAGIVLTVYAAAWVAGFVTPGAPAGLGVREAVITVSLTGYIGESGSLLAALIFRMITVAGDLIFFLTSFFQRKKQGEV
jgi:glycosyltransferase 2 family protein